VCCSFTCLGAGRSPLEARQSVGCRVPCRWVEFREEVLKLENGREVLFSGRVDNASVPWITDSIQRVIVVWHRQQAYQPCHFHPELSRLKQSSECYQTACLCDFSMMACEESVSLPCSAESLDSLQLAACADAFHFPACRSIQGGRGNCCISC
jgi:hypothetical protein